MYVMCTMMRVCYPAVLFYIVLSDVRKTHTKQWQITGSKKDYDALPEWLRPGAAQLVTGHPAWVDVFPWSLDPHPHKIFYDSSH